MLPAGDQRKALIQHAMRSESGNKIKLLITLAAGMKDLAIAPDDWDANPWLLNCQNGTINLKTGKLQPFNKADYITRICSASFDENCATPLWDTLLETITKGDADTIRYMQKALGYALTGDTSEQAMFMLYGTGSNGKSTFLNIFSAVMNTYAQSASSDAFMQKKNESVNNDIARLKGARFVTAIEMEENKRLAESLIKSMTGGDKLVTRFLYGEYFEYVPQFKVFLAANHKPIIRDTTHSIWRRIKLMPFENTFTEANRDKHFADKIMAKEIPGILAWAVKGASSGNAKVYRIRPVSKGRQRSTGRKWTHSQRSLRNAVRHGKVSVYRTKCCVLPMTSGAKTTANMHFPSARSARSFWKWALKRSVPQAQEPWNGSGYPFAVSHRGYD